MSGGGGEAPVYTAPEPPSRDELLQRQATALSNQGAALYNKRKFREAIRMFEASLKVFAIQKTRENLGSAYNQLALEYDNKGDHKEAARYLELAGQYNPGDSHISSNQAIVRDKIEAERAEESGRAEVGKNLDGLSRAVTRMQAVTTAPGLDFDNGGTAPVASKSSDPLVFLAPNGQSTGDTKGGTPANTADLRTPPPSARMPTVAEIEKSPGIGEARKAFQAIIAKDWPVAIAWYKQALLKDPENAALKRSLDLAEYTQSRRLEIARLRSPMFEVLDIWSSGDNKTALSMLEQVEKQHPEMKSRVADVRHGLLLVERYRQSPAYREEIAKTAKAANELMLEGTLEMAQRSMVDDYVATALRYVASGNIPEARLMLKTALADDNHNGGVRVLLEIVDTLESPPDQRPQSQATPSNIHN